MQKIVISILNFNNSSDTKKCLDSIMTQSTQNFKVMTYVLDNGSVEKIDIDQKNYEKINLQIIMSPKNLGFTGGHNFIFKNINYKYDYFLLLNNDCILDKDSLENLISGFDGKTGAVVPKIYFTKGQEYHHKRYKDDEKGKVIWYAGGKMDWDNIQSLHIGVDEVDTGQFEIEREIDFATGACVLIKDEVLKKIGLFDEKYFLYYEDADLSQRIIKAGFKIRLIPKSIIWHSNASSSGVGSALHDYYLTRNRLLFASKFAKSNIKPALFKESTKLLLTGRKWQKIGVRDFIIKKFGKGSFNG